jgi:hypothetical protein
MCCLDKAVATLGSNERRVWSSGGMKAREKPKKIGSSATSSTTKLS